MAAAEADLLAVSAAVLRVAAALPVQVDRWTVLAGVALRRGDTCIALSVATGTKCEPPPRPEDRDLVVLDSHAEVLARRGLVLCLINELELLAANAEYKSPLLVPWRQKDAESSASPRYLVDGELVMFITDSPCGQASEYARVGGLSTRVSGSRPVGSSLLRTKPGRSDLPDHLLTRCMSCADKLCRWVALGLQGEALSNLLEPVRLSSIVLGKDAVLLAKEDDSPEWDPVAADAVSGALRKSLERAAGLGPVPKVMVDPTAEFPQSRWRIDRPQPGVKRAKQAAGSAASDMAVSWVRDAPGGNFGRRKRAGEGWYEVVVKGIRQGASRARGVDSSMSSDLCRAALRARALALSGDESASAASRVAKARFFSDPHFSEWVGREEANEL